MPEAFCGIETVRKWVLLNLWVLWEKKLCSELFVCYLIEWVRSISHRFTQKNRTHSIPQRPCGRQISQNLTAIFGSNALWTLYAGGVLWARNRALKTSVTSVCSVRDKTPQRVRKLSQESASEPFVGWNVLFSMRMKNIYKEWWDRLLFTIEILARWETITYMISESYEHETSICFSCIKKGLFLYQEGHVLGWRRAFSWALKGMGRMGEGRK